MSLQLKADENSPLYEGLPIMVLLFMQRSDGQVHVCLEQDVLIIMSTYLCLDPFLALNMPLTSTTLA